VPVRRFSPSVDKHKDGHKLPTKASPELAEEGKSNQELSGRTVESILAGLASTKPSKDGISRRHIGNSLNSTRTSSLPPPLTPSLQPPSFENLREKLSSSEREKARLKDKVEKLELALKIASTRRQVPTQQPTSEIKVSPPPSPRSHSSSPLSMPCSSQVRNGDESLAMPSPAIPSLAMPSPDVRNQIPEQVSAVCSGTSVVSTSQTQLINKDHSKNDSFGFLLTDNSLASMDISSSLFALTTSVLSLVDINSTYSAVLGTEHCKDE